jgi:glutaryl-CoA dehydrogenase
MRDGDGVRDQRGQALDRHGTVADVRGVWARDIRRRQVKGFLVETGTPGLRRRAIEGKALARARGRPNQLTDVRVAAETGCPAPTLRTPAGAALDPDTVRVGRARPRVAAYDAGAHVLRAAQAVRQAAVQFQIVQDSL